MIFFIVKLLTRAAWI